MPSSLQTVAHRSLLWHGDNLAVPDLPCVPTGFAMLDEALPGGGWPRGALTEILPARTGIGEISLLAPALTRLSRQDPRWIVWVAPPSPQRMVPLSLPMAQVVPLFAPGHLRRGALVGAGYGLGDGLRRAVGTRDAVLHAPRAIGAAEVARLAPAVRRDGLRGGVQGWDGQLIDDRGDHLARNAPDGPEIDEHGQGRLRDFFLEIGVGDVHDILSHVGLLVWIQ